MSDEHLQALVEDAEELGLYDIPPELWRQAIADARKEISSGEA